MDGYIDPYTCIYIYMDGYSYISPVPNGSTIWSSTNMAMGKAPVFMGKMDSPEPNHLGAPNVAWFPSSPGWAKSIKAHKSCARVTSSTAFSTKLGRSNALSFETLST